MNTREALEQKRKEWLKQKGLEEQIKQVGVNLENLNNDNNIIADLSLRITEKLQNKLKVVENTGKEQRKIENLISKEIEQNTCAICYELMMPPTYSPILLFPCGHTFCKQCVLDQNKALNSQKLRISKCPVCRQNVQSTAPNISLQNLICVYTNNQQYLIDNQKQKQDDQSVKQQELQQGEQSKEFMEKYQMCNLRIDILKSEAEEIKQNNNAIKKEIQNNDQVILHLNQRFECVQTSIKKLQDELDLIMQHIQQTELQNQNLNDVKSQNEVKFQYIVQTIEQIFLEKQKYKLLSQFND